MAIAATVVACLIFYLLALESYCDQGGKFALGICSITRFIPW
ncbi:PhoP/PhoQ regulator MgrB [Serratia aquatilis]|uniref:PhoP/PhoQ regulator MgrB n=1 Tax=Serratia aquatilis TaxID=1737515 RepID=A0ABV6E9B5_9GAMM